MDTSLPYKNHARSWLGYGNECCHKCPQGEVGSPCWVLYGKPMSKQRHWDVSPLWAHVDESTASLVRKIRT